MSEHKKCSHPLAAREEIKTPLIDSFRLDGVRRPYSLSYYGMCGGTGVQ